MTGRLVSGNAGSEWPSQWVLPDPVKRQQAGGNVVGMFPQLPLSRNPPSEGLGGLFMSRGHRLVCPLYSTPQLSPQELSFSHVTVGSSGRGLSGNAYTLRSSVAGTPISLYSVGVEGGLSGGSRGQCRGNTNTFVLSG